MASHLPQRNGSKCRGAVETCKKFLSKIDSIWSDLQLLDLGKIKAKFG